MESELEQEILTSQTLSRLMPLNERERLDSWECHTPKRGEKREGEGTGCK